MLLQVLDSTGLDETRARTILEKEVLAKQRLTNGAAAQAIDLAEESNKDRLTNEDTREADEQLNADAARGCMKINKFFAAAPPAVKAKGIGEHPRQQHRLS